ncbi:hypothetical protein A3710_23350 [Stutzerimonas frequens]|nr:hypothetical protein A3710_23350 [Stutzerimonas frequens]
MRGAGFAKLGLDDEAVIQGIARSGLEAFLDFNRFTIAATSHDWLSGEAMIGPYKHHRTIFQCVDRIGLNCNRHGRSARAYPHFDEQAGTPNTFRVRKRDPGGSGAALLTNK